MSMQMGGLPQALGGAYAMGGPLGAHMAGAHMAAGGGLGGQMPMGGQSAMLMSAPMPYPSVQPLPGGAFAASAGDPGPQAGPCTFRNARSAVTIRIRRHWPQSCTQHSPMSVCESS